MLELAASVAPLLAAGERVAIVTVVRVTRSAPRGPGAAMAVTLDDGLIGSISGGCVEGDAALLAAHALRSGRAVSRSLGYSDARAIEMGLACGGSLDIVVSLVEPGSVAAEALTDAAAGRAAEVGIIVSGERAGEVVAPRDLDPQRIPTRPEGSAAASGGREGAFMLEEAYNGADVLLVRVEAPPLLVIVGANEHAAALCRLGSAAGYSVTVCDPWGRLLTPDRFPEADRLVEDHAHHHLASLDPERLDERTAVCILSHDERIDVPALRVALALPVGFVGAMGSRATVARREALLRQAGVAETALARLHSPLGLDLGGSSPTETALAVLAEITAARHGGTGIPLRHLSGRIHGSAAETDAEAVGTAPACPLDAPLAPASLAEGRRA